jgi:hypothetical protein
MEKVFDADGNEIEALGSEEVEKLESRARQADELEEKVAELQKQLDEEGNPNWREARAKMSALQNFIKEKGFEVDKDGNIKDAEEKIDPDKIKEEVRNELKAESFKEAKDELLDEFSSDTKPLIEKYVNKLLQGEEQNLKNLRKAIAEAERLVIGENKDKPIRVAGDAPKFTQDGKDFSNTEKGQEVAGLLFGDNSFTNKK